MRNGENRKKSCRSEGKVSRIHRRSASKGKAGCDSTRTGEGRVENGVLRSNEGKTGCGIPQIKEADNGERAKKRVWSDYEEGKKHESSQKRGKLEGIMRGKQRDIRDTEVLIRKNRQNSRGSEKTRDKSSWDGRGSYGIRGKRRRVGNGPKGAENESRKPEGTGSELQQMKGGLGNEECRKSKKTIGTKKANRRKDEVTAGYSIISKNSEITGNKGKRQKGPCSAAHKCGGCKWINMPYEEQLRQKEEWIRELLSSYCRTEPIIGMEEPGHYRNKVHAVFGEDRKHNVISGIYEKGTHNIVPVDSCLIENKKADEIIVTIRKLLPSFKIRPYNEDSGYGLFRHVLIRTGYSTGEIMVVLVLSSPILPSKNNFVKALLKIHPEITTIVINVNNRGTSMILGDKEQVIYGKGYIEDVLCGRTFRISPKSFYQVNPVQTEKLYQKALEYAGLTGKETVVDAYCGIGTIGLTASDCAARVIGVELNGDAVRDARINAKRNGVDNIQFYQNDAGQFLTELARQQEHVDVVMMDPPRAGSNEAFLDAVLTIHPDRIVYISCSPETLVRDLKYLCMGGYEARMGVGVDMFPFTEHVETVVLLSCNK